METNKNHRLRLEDFSPISGLIEYETRNQEIVTDNRSYRSRELRNSPRHAAVRRNSAFLEAYSIATSSGIAAATVIGLAYLFIR